MPEFKTNKYKRVQQIRRDTDTVKNVSVTTDDIVRSIKEYIINKINPEVTENGQTRKVPVHYANPERWKDIQKNGWMRDPKSNQIMVPAIVFKLTSISKNTDIPLDKLDGELNMLIKTGWDKKYRYDFFNINNNVLPPTNYYSVLLPDYMKFSFDVNIWTGYVSQMNRLIEKFIYYEGTYWGDKSKNLFKCSIDNYNNTIDLDSGQDRAVRNNFTLEVNGYILPESYKNNITTIKKLNPTKVVLAFETEKGVDLLKNSNNEVIYGNIDGVIEDLRKTVSLENENEEFIWYLQK